MNQRIAEERMYWRAGRNEMVGRPIMEKERIFGSKFNTLGFEYYTGGIFEFLPWRKNSETTSLFTEEFDWQNRHDANDSASKYYNPSNHGWILHADDQTVCLACWIFASTHTFSDFINIYCNDLRNVDLSEQEMLTCVSSNCGDCLTGGEEYCVMDYIAGNGIHRENACQAYLSPDADTCTTVCTYSEKFKFGSHDSTCVRNEDTLKKLIITKGPLVSGLFHPIFNPQGHYMELVGYKIMEYGDTVYIGSNTLTWDSAYVGQPSWIFKNSDLGTNPEFFIFKGDLDFFYPADIVSGPVTRIFGTQTVIKPLCKDEDNDGYYWWGVEPDPSQCGCPSGVLPGQQDCNDNDPALGPYISSNDTISGLRLFDCKPLDCTTRSTPLDILGDSIWIKDRHINQDIIIHSRGSLTIRGQVFFTPDAKIIVESAASLILEGQDTIHPPRLTSACGQFWRGIEIWGDPLLQQNSTNQGKVVINNGIIEHAACGIKTLISGYLNDGDSAMVLGLPTGGIIEANRAVFRNNVTGVEFFPYRDGTNPNLSKFTVCRFETTDELFNSAQPVYGIKLSGVNHIDIKGCTFINSRPNTVGYSSRGGGIYAYNAQFTVGDTTLYSRIINTDFRGLNYGIRALKSPMGPSQVAVTGAGFTSNRGGIYLSGFQEVSPVELKQNTFTLLENFDQDNQYGIYLENCSGYKVSLNSVSGNKNVGGEQFGIIVNNSGPENNYIYKNYFQNLKVGIQGFNINRNDDPQSPTGLRLICNQFVNTGCANDFLINENLENPAYQPGIAYNQRNAANISNGTQEPAGNIFTFNHGTDTTVVNYDINIENSVSSILYTHHTTSTILNIRLKPDKVSDSSKVAYVAFPDFPFDSTDSCPNGFYPEGPVESIKESINESDYKADSLSTLLKMLIDAGSTDSLKTIVDYSFSAQLYELYQDLMSASPYLSDTVVKASIEKEEVLPNAMIRDIMVANPQSSKSEALLATLDNRFTPMPDSMWAEILQGMDIIGAKERLEDELVGWLQRKDLNFNALAGQYLTDTIHSWAPDSLIALYQSDNRLSSRYWLVQYYLDHSKFSQATAILQNVPSEFELNDQQEFSHQHIVSLASLFPQLFADTLGYLTPDSAQTATLQQIANDNSLFPGAWARNILISCDLLDYTEPIVFTNNLKSSRKEKYHWKSSGSTLSDFRVFPNPARDFVIVECQKDKSSDKVTIEFIDIKGDHVKSVLLQGRQNEVIIPVGDLISGSYLIRYTINGAVQKSSKVIIIR